MKQVVKVKGVVFGEGSPKICIPIVGRTYEEIIMEAHRLAEIEFDVLELRIDFFKDVAESESVIKLLREIRSLCTKPILFTFRTKQEGGEAQIESEQYVALYRSVIDTGLADMVDLELFLGDELVSSLAAYAKERQVVVVMSNHDFYKTPAKEEIINRLVRMQQLGADLPKIAVMPNSKKDVMTVLEATFEMSEKHRETPIITMSMGRLGVISRVAGELTGSAMTFATNGKASAPGQIPIEEMRQILSIMG